MLTSSIACSGCWMPAFRCLRSSSRHRRGCRNRFCRHPRHGSVMRQQRTRRTPVQGRLPGAQRGQQTPGNAKPCMTRVQPTVQHLCSMTGRPCNGLVACLIATSAEYMYPVRPAAFALDLRMGQCAWAECVRPWHRLVHPLACRVSGNTDTEHRGCVGMCRCEDLADCVWLQEHCQALRQRRPLEELQGLAQRRAGHSPPAPRLRALRASTSWMSTPTVVQVMTMTTTNWKGSACRSCCRCVSRYLQFTWIV